MTRRYFGRHVYAIGAVLYGVLALVWRDCKDWNPIRPLGHIPHCQAVFVLLGVVQILGGLALVWRPTARVGVLVLGALYVFLALLAVPDIFSEPLVYNSWGEFFYLLSLISGALILYATAFSSDSQSSARLAHFAYLSFGVCVVSFTLEQIFYFQGTVVLVPKWIPPNQTFWAMATTVAFGLAAIALLSGRFALLAARLLTAMLLGFNLLTWLPILINDPHKLFNWTESAETLAITGAAWIVADFLATSGWSPGIARSPFPR